MTNKFKISQAADFLGVSTKTLRRWDAAKHLIPQRTAGGQRFYTRVQLESAMGRKPQTFHKGDPLHTQGSPLFNPIDSFNAVAGKQYQEAKALEEVQEQTTNFNKQSFSSYKAVALHTQGRRLFQPQARGLLAGARGLLATMPRALAMATVMSILLFVYDVSGFWGTKSPLLTKVSGGLTKLASQEQGLRSYLTLHKKTSPMGKSSLSATKPVPTSQVLAATDVNLPFHFAVDVPAIFSEDITAPNVIYSLTAGDGITITGDQDLTITGSGTTWKSFKLGTTTLSAGSTTDTFEYVAGGSVSLALDTTNKKLTITGSTDASTLDSLDSTAFLRADTSDSYTSGTLTFSDGTLLDLSGILHDDTAAQGLKLPQSTSLTAPSTGEGFIAYNTTDNQMYVYNGTAWGATGYFSLGGTTGLYITDTTYNLGIGTTVPSAKLDVVGDAEFTGNVGFGTSMYWNNTTNRLGIGTTVPSYTTDITGTLQVTGSGFTGLRMPTGSEENYVLTTDGDGNASWTDTTGGGAFGAWTLTGSTIYPNLTTYNLLLGSTNVLDSVAKLVNTGSTLYKPLDIADLPTGGAIGTAIATVDIYTTFNVTQTTASQTLTLPTPTSAIAGRLVYVANTGSVPFTLLGSVVTAGTTTQVMWNGTAWTLTGANSGVPSGTVNNTTMRWNTATSTWQENTSVVATSAGLVGIGTTAPSTNLHIISTTEQMRLGYDASNYLSFTIGSTGNLTLADSGTSIATMGSENAEFFVPTTFSATGDITVAYDLIMANQSASNIISKGPITLEAGQIYENNNLTLKTYGTGDVFLDMGGNLLLQSADPAIVFDTLTATDTDFWMGITEDAGSDDDDIFSIGEGVGIGTSTYFSINTSGYVGLGTTNPANILDVEGGMAIGATYSGTSAAPTNGLIVQGNLGVGTTTPYGNLQVSGSTGFVVATTDFLHGGGVGTSLIISPLAATGNTVMAIDAYTSGDGSIGNLAISRSTGKVGIGTTAPGTKLGIVGGVGIGTTDSFANAAVAANNLAVQGAIGIGVTNPAVTTGLSVQGTTEQLRLAYDVSNYLSFTIGSTGNLTLADSGTTIGTFGSELASFAVPTEFTSSGDVTVANDLVFSNDTIANIQSGGPLSITAGETFGSSNLTLKTYGTGDLFADISGNFLMQSADPAMVFDTLTATDTDFWMGITEDAGGDDDDYFQIGDGTVIGTTPFLTLNTSGYLGIGTTTPGKALGVVGGVGIGTTDSFANAAIAANQLAVQGNVGIGLTNPSYDLEIGTADTPELSFLKVLNPMTSTTIGSILFRGTDSDVRTGAKIEAYAEGVNWGTNTNDAPTQLRFYTQSNADTDDMAQPHLTITNGGLVGIGTTGPAEKLDVVLTNPSYIKATSLSNDAGFKIASDNTGEIKLYSANNQDDFRIYINSGDRFVIDATGLIGIGTTSPKAALGVVGGVGIGTTDSFANAAIAANTLAVQGRVGVGISAPTSALYVHNNPGLGSETQKAAVVIDQYESQDLLTASASGTTKFAVSASGAIYMGDNTTLGTSTAVCWEAATLNNDDAVFKLGDCTGTPADLAEMYPARKLETLNSKLETVSDFGFSASDLPEAGEIVSIAESLGTYTTSDGVTHQAFGVEKATKDTAHKMAGIVSTKAWQVIGEDVLDWADQAVPVALTGRVPVKITPSSAPILAGDMITISDDSPGAGKKSDGNGYIIGKALEDWDPANPTSTILVFLQNSVNIAGVLEDTRVTNLEAEVELLKAASLTGSPIGSGMTADDLSIQNLSVLSSSILGDVTITGGLTIASLADINFNNNIIIDQKGNLSIKSGVILGNDNFRGELTVSASATTVRVDKVWDTTPVSITITPSWNTTVWVTEKGQSGFTVNFGTSAPADTNINWLAVF